MISLNRLISKLKIQNMLPTLPYFSFLLNLFCVFLCILVIDDQNNYTVIFSGNNCKTATADLPERQTEDSFLF